jgi:hypothetical protein
MKTTVWNTKKDKPAKAAELDKLIEDGDLYVNYHTIGSVNIGVIWMELSTIGEYTYHLVNE